MRSLFYLFARILGDVFALLSGRLVARIVNKLIGRHIVRRLWWR